MGKRKIIYHDIGLIISDAHNPGILYDLDNDTPTDLITALTSYIDESKQQKAEVFIAWSGLKWQRITTLNAFHALGYNYEYKGKKEMRVGDMRGRFTEDGIFYIQVKTGYKCYVTIQAIDPVISLKKPARTLDELKEQIALYHYSRDNYYRGLKKTETRILYSSASMSRTLFNRKNPAYSKSFLLLKGRQRELEEYNRPGVHGGFNAVSQLGYKYTGPGIVLDVNSLYPYVAANARIPGLEIIDHGDGEPDRKYIRHKATYYTIMKVTVSATLKKDGIECIYSEGFFSDITNTALKTMDMRKLTLNEADRKLLFDNYSITYFRIESYYVFHVEHAFKKYVETLYSKKKTATGIERNYVKAMLNGFLGTLARKVYKDSYDILNTGQFLYIQKRPLSPDEMEKAKSKVSGLCYIYGAITSAARLYIIHYIKQCRDRWLYTDTDSIHLSGADIPQGIPISDDLGAFKVEHEFTQCIYKSTKNYILVEDGKIVPTVSGVPKDVFEIVYKADGVDTRYIQKALLKKDISKLYAKPIAIPHYVEDLATMEVTIEASKGWLQKPQTQSKAAEQKKKRDDRIRRAHEAELDCKYGLQEEQDAKDMAAENDYNRIFASPAIEFEQAVEILRSIRNNGLTATKELMYG